MEIGGYLLLHSDDRIRRLTRACGRQDSMKKDEEIQSVLFKKFEDVCKGLSDVKTEFVDAQIDNKETELSKLAAAKKAAADNYKAAENAYLLQTSVGETQYLVVLKAVAEFATLKEDKGFLLWVKANNVLESINEVVADTPTRLLSWINASYDSYVKGRKEANNKKAAAAAAKAARAKALADLKASGVSLEEILAEFGM